MAGLWSGYSGLAGYAGLNNGSGLSSGSGISPPPGGAPSYYVDFSKGVFPPWLAYNMTSQAWYFDVTGKLQTAPNNITKNSALAGAVVGTPGTLPTGFQVYAAAGLTTSVVAFGTDSASGLPYVDLRLNGTTNATGYVLAYDSQTPCTIGQQFIGSASYALVGGTTANITAFKNTIRFNNTPAETIFTPTATLTQSFVLGTASTTPAVQALNVTFSSGVAIDVTLRIAGAQMEQVTPAQTTPRPFLLTTGAAIFKPMIEYDQQTLAFKGFRTEPAATNGVKNSAAYGGSTPSTQPTGWQAMVPPAGLTITYGAFTSANGIPYVTIVITGTPSATGSVRLVIPTLNNEIAAASGQTWAQSWFLAATNLTNCSFNIYTYGFQSDGTTVSENFQSGNLALTTTLTRYSLLSTLAVALTAYVRPNIQLNYTISQAINMTLTVAIPQMEQTAMSSPILSYGAAITRAACNAVGGGALGALTAMNGRSVLLERTLEFLAANLISFSWGDGATFANASYWSEGPVQSQYVITGTGTTVKSSPTTAQARLVSSEGPVNGNFGFTGVAGASIARSNPNVPNRFVLGDGAWGVASTSPMWASKLAVWARTLTPAEIASKIVLGSPVQ